MGKSKTNPRNVILVSDEVLTLINEDMESTVGESLGEYIFDRVFKPWVEQSPNLPNDLLEYPKYTRRHGGNYQVRRWVDGVELNYGTFPSKKEAVQVTDYLIYRDWDGQLSCKETKLKGDK